MKKGKLGKQIFNKLLLPLIFICLVVVTIYAVGHKRNASSAGVVIKLNNPVEQSLMTESHIYDLITDYEPELIQGGAMADIDLEMIEYFLLEDESVENAEIYLDNSGDRIPLSKNTSIRVPVITGEIDPHFEDFMDYEVHNLKGVFTLARTIQKDPFMQAFIEQFHLNKNGEVTMVPKLGDLLIQFGQVEKVDKKLRNMKAFYKEVINKKGWDRYESISLNYDGQIVCTKKEKLSIN